MNDVSVDEYGFIQHIKIDSSEDVIDGDFFIDATGFSREILSKISENDFVKHLNRILELNIDFSYFEKCVLLSFLYFRESDFSTAKKNKVCIISNTDFLSLRIKTNYYGSK